MTYFITALTNDRAQLIASETRTTSATVAELVKAHLAAAGFIVFTREEG